MWLVLVLPGTPPQTKCLTRSTTRTPRRGRRGRPADEVRRHGEVDDAREAAHAPRLREPLRVRYDRAESPTILDAGAGARRRVLEGAAASPRRPPLRPRRRAGIRVGGRPRLHPLRIQMISRNPSTRDARRQSSAARAMTATISIKRAVGAAFSCSLPQALRTACRYHLKQGELRALPLLWQQGD